MVSVYIRHRGPTSQTRKKKDAGYEYDENVFVAWVLQVDAKSTPLTQIHGRSLSWLATGTSIKKWWG
jgi:hypothetical protein